MSTSPSSAWRWFPAGLIASLGIVIAVNGVMIFDALKTFPGEAGTDGFDLSNQYGRVIAAERQQAALGWHVETGVDQQRRPVVLVTDRDGQALAGAAVEAAAERPVGPEDYTRLALRDLGGGRLQSDTHLFSGQWDLLVTVRSGNHVYTTTRRVVVR
ncbi:FixH family protein [Rhodopila sp.]|jgi:nitrogen fixation protein FixH|uniref:FixH family protein n=1 Tax=Rhodopila sp. TaxID=2480087 RepID=UPI002BE43EE4|nr:FixH family protein [Rhodopila sp.]HVZ08155.1 FixH family protein [Rhodopila sp.]